MHRSAGALQICVQSMDGQLSFYERETLAFSRFLPQFLLPGPLCYSQALDCIITCSSAYEVECYKYQTLAAAQAAATRTTGATIVTPVLMHVSCIIHVASMVAKHCTCTANSVMSFLPLPGPDTNSKGKQLHTEWKWVFGEMAWDIQISRFTGEQSPLLVLPTTTTATSSSLPKANSHACKVLYSLLQTLYEQLGDRL